MIKSNFSTLFSGIRGEYFWNSLHWMPDRQRIPKRWQRLTWPFGSGKLSKKHKTKVNTVST